MGIVLLRFTPTSPRVANKSREQRLCACMCDLGFQGWHGGRAHHEAQFSHGLCNALQDGVMRQAIDDFPIDRQEQHAGLQRISTR